MWNDFVRPIRDHLPLWLVMVPLVGIVVVRLSTRFGDAVVRRVLLTNVLTSVLLCVWMVAAYEPLKPAATREQASYLGPIEQFQLRSSFGWVGESRTTTLEGNKRMVELPVRWGPDIRIEFGVDGISLWFITLSMVLVAAAMCGIGEPLSLTLSPEYRGEGTGQSAADGGQRPLSLTVSPEYRVEGTGQSAADGGQRPLSLTLSPKYRGEGTGQWANQSASWLWLEASLIGTFAALDVVLFAVCWMSTLLAIAWLLGHGGDADRHDVTPRLWKPAAVGSWFVTLGLCGLVLAFGWMRQTPNRPQPPLIFSVPELIAGIGHWTVAGDRLYLWSQISPWLFWLLTVGFTGPLLLAPFHRGFVAALVSAPPSVAVMLAGVLIKVGLYGWLRFVLPVFPDLLRQHVDGLATLIGLSSLLAAGLAFGQTDWRRRAAMATSSSLGLSLLAVMTLTLEGLTGGLLRAFSHGLSAALLLWLLPRSYGQKAPLPGVPGRGNRTNGDAALVASLVQQNRNSRRRQLAFRVALFAWIGLPGLSGFVAEVVSPFGLIQHEFNVALLSLTTSGLIAWMWVRADREQLKWSTAPWPTREWIVVGTLIALNVAMGLAPQFVISRMQPSLIAILPLQEESPTEPVAIEF